MKDHDVLPEMVWAYRAAGPGPAAAVVGGVHGNERAGIRVIEILRNMFEAGPLVPARGTVFLALGDPYAIAAGVRSVGEDLNRCFTTAVLAGAGNAPAHLRARELAAAFRDVRFGIDIHGTNTPSRPFLVVQRARRPDDDGPLGCLAADLVLRDPDLVFAGEAATLDEYFARDGGLGVCYETGAAGDDSNAERIASEVIGALACGGWVAGGNGGPVRPPKAEFVLRKRIDLTAGGFRFAEGVGGVNFQPLAKGDVVGSHGDAPLIADEDCLLVFPKPEHLRAVGRPVGYLASRA